MKSLQHIQVLLIEDSPSDVLLLQVALETDPIATFALTQVERLEDGIKRLQQGSFDIILADLGLPDSSGLETFERLHQSAPTIPVVVFSGNDDEEQAILAVSNGAQDYLVKSPNGFDMTARSIRYAIERHKLQSSLRESEERHRLISGLISDYVYSGTVRSDGSSVLNWVSGAFERITGFTPEEINHFPNGFSDLVQPDDLQTMISEQVQFLQERSRTAEYRIRRKGGDICWLRDYMRITEIDPQTNTLHLMGAVQDITERKRADEKLRESQQQMQALVLSLDDIVLEVDEDGTYLNIWTANDSILFKPRDELIGKRFDQVFGEEAGRPYHEYLEKALQSNTSQTLEYALELAGGSRWFGARYNPIHAEHKAKRTVSILVRDITERKQAEEALRESEERFSTAFFTNPVAQSILSLQTGKVVEVNNSCCHLFEFSREELIGSDPGKLNLWANPADELAALDELQKTGHLLAREVTIQLKWGKKRTILFTVEPIPWKGVPCLITSSVDISERKRAEEQLRESEERSRAMVNAIPDMMFRMDRNGTFLDYKAEPKDLHEQSQDLLGKRNRDLVPPQFADLIENKIHETLSTGSLQTFEYQLAVPGAGDRAFEARMVPSGPDEIIAIVRNITERNRAQRALMDSEARLKSLIDSAMDAIVTVNQDLDIVLFNSAAEKMFGVPAAEALGSPISRFIPGRFHEIHWQKMSSMRETSTRDEFINQVFPIIGLRSSGEEFPAESAVSYVERNGEVFFTSILRDVTGRRRAEAQLRTSEERLRKTLEITSDGFWIVDADHRLIDVNEAYCAMSGYSRDELLRMRIADLEARESIQEIERHVAKIFSQGRDHFETLHRRKNGSIFDVEVSTNVLNLDADFLICFCRDITERKKAEREAIHRQELLEKVIQLGKRVTALTDLENCLLEIYNGARFELGFDRIGLFLYDASLRHGTGIYGTTRTGEIEPPGFREGAVDEFRVWDLALQHPAGICWIEDYQERFHPPADDVMYGVGQHLTVTAWAGDKPVAIIAADNLLTGRTVTAWDIEALQLFAGYAGLAIENASLHTELELKVEERTAEVQDLYDHAPTGYHSLDAEGRFTQVNETELNWLGYTREEFIGLSILELLTPDSIETFRRNFPMFKQTGILHDLEMDFIRKDRTILPTLVNASAVYDSQGNYISSRSTMLDNSVRKKAEEALRQNEETYRALFEKANDGIFIFSLDNVIQRANPNGAEMLGYPVEELIGKYGNDFVPGENVMDAEQKWQRILAGERLPAYERKLLKKDGTWIESEINLSLIRDATGNPKFIQSVVRDVSTRKHAEEALRLANIELERALRLKDEFLASMSHELRTPLTGILGLSEALQYDTYGELTPRQKKVISNIEINGHHLLDLINDILDISKMEAGKLELEMLPCSMDEICQSSLQLVKGMAQKKGQHLAFSMNPAGVLVKGDARRLKQIVVNLLSNAVKYSPEGRPVGLNVAADAATQTLTIEVWDQGMGIAPGDLKRLFQPFVQLDSSLSRQQSGTGLGLALVQRLVDLHGGSIEVESEIGQGSRFTVRLPYLLHGAPEPAHEEQAEVLPYIQQSLIVEDNGIDAHRITRFLKLLGIQSMVEDRGEGVVEKAAATQPGVILLDINLPDMPGWDVIEKLKQHEATRTIPIVITSVVDDRERANRLGAAGYLLKPVTLDELRLILSRLPKPVGTHNDRALVVSPNAHTGVIMIVDDNETNVLMIEDFLQSRNYKVFSSTSGVDFLFRVAEIHPDLVLMDIQMPDMDGLETIQRLRILPDPELASTPVIAITALAMPGDRERCLGAGANEYISKPVRLKELVSIIQKILLEQQDPSP